MNVICFNLNVILLQPNCRADTAVILQHIVVQQHEALHIYTLGMIFA